MSIRQRLWVLLVLLPIITGARVEVTSDELHIDANRTVLNFKSSTRTYSGDVLVTHENFELTADEVIETDSPADSKRVFATGNPVRFRQSVIAGTNAVRLQHGVASKVEYLVGARILRLWDYKVTDIKGNVLTGKRMRYRLKPQTPPSAR